MQETPLMEKSHLQQRVQDCFKLFNSVYRATAGKVTEDCRNESHQKPGMDSWQTLQREGCWRKFMGDHKAIAGRTTTGEVNSDDIHRTLKYNFLNSTIFSVQVLLLK